MRGLLIPFVCAMILVSSLPVFAGIIPRNALCEEEMLTLQKLEISGPSFENLSGGNFTSRDQVISHITQFAVILLPLFVVCMAYAHRGRLAQLAAWSMGRSSFREDRRIWTRITLSSQPTSVTFPSLKKNDQMLGQVVDISRGGLSVTFHGIRPTLRCGDSLEMDIDVGNQTSIFSRLHGTVRWIRGNKVGIKFHNLLNMDLGVLYNMIVQN